MIEDASHCIEAGVGEQVTGSTLADGDGIVGRTHLQRIRFIAAIYTPNGSFSAEHFIVNVSITANRGGATGTQVLVHGAFSSHAGKSAGVV